MAPAAQAISWPAWRNRHLPASAGNELLWLDHVRVVAMQEPDPSGTARLWESTSCSSSSSSSSSSTTSTSGYRLNKATTISTTHMQ